MRQLSAWLAAGLLWLATSASAATPIGNADAVVPSGNDFFTWGWTCDPDTWGTVLAVHFYVDGVFFDATAAGTERGDLVGVCAGTTAHGYGLLIDTQNMSVGQHWIQAFAIDGNGGPLNPLLGTLYFTVSAPSGQTPNAPYGWHDWVAPSGGSFLTHGWTCDPDNWGMSLTVRFYLDNPIGSGTFVGSTVANVQRDLASVCGGTTAHGFNFT